MPAMRKGVACKVIFRLQLNRNRRLNEQAAISKLNHDVTMNESETRLAENTSLVKRSNHFTNRVGERHGRWEIVEFVVVKNLKSMWLCKCDCGKEKILFLDRFKQSNSCGCLARELAKIQMTTHGYSKLGMKEYKAWSSMKERCLNPNNKRFHSYGGRGIKICERWLNSFPDFFQDMGNAPIGFQLERKDNQGNYEPENCKWASRVEQANNKRNNRLITFMGKTQTVAEWSRETGLGFGIIHQRIARKCPIDRLFAPVSERYKRL